VAPKSIRLDVSSSTRTASAPAARLIIVVTLSSRYREYFASMRCTSAIAASAHMRAMPASGACSRSSQREAIA
jgi:hypothetical protein